MTVTTTSLLNHSFITGLAISIVLIILLLSHPSHDRYANRIFAALIACLSCLLIGPLIKTNATQHQLNPAFFSSYALLMLIGPLLCGYINRVKHRKSIEVKEWGHCIPAIIIFCLLGVGPWVEANNSLYSTLLAFIGPSIYSHLVVYLVLAIVKITKKDSNAHLQLSRNWLYSYCLILSAGLLAMVIVETNLLPRLNFNPTALTVYLSSVLAFYFVILALAYFGLNQQIFQFAPAHPSRSSRKYANSSLRDDTAAHLYRKLQACMIEDQLFLDSQLSLQSLAKTIGTNPHHLSQIINQRLGKTYYDYINGLRIEFAITQLRQPRNHQQTITAIAFDSGYNNKASFYKAFKQITGTTPNEYLKNLPIGENHNLRG